MPLQKRRCTRTDSEVVLADYTDPEALLAGCTATQDSTPKEQLADWNCNSAEGLHNPATERVEGSSAVVLAVRKAATGRAAPTQHSRPMSVGLQEEESGPQEGRSPVRTAVY